MPKSKQQQQLQGFTLLELLLVLLVITGILLASYSHYRKIKQTQSIALLKQNVAALLNDTDICYANYASQYHGKNSLNCKKNISSLISIQSCKINLNKLLDNDLVSAKTTNYYKVTAPAGVEVKAPTNNPCGTDQPFYIHPLRVMVTIKATYSAQISWFLAMLGATGIANKTQLYWQKMPSYFIPGIGNNLWLLGGELAVFKKAETLSQ